MASKRPRVRVRAPVVEPMLTHGSMSDAERLFSAVREFLVGVHEPLVLVSGIQRSGGTLLNSLLDGHPQLHTYPYELVVGDAKGDGWPLLETPPDTTAFLTEDRTGQLFRDGYSKGNVDGTPTLPYLIPPSLVASLFRSICADGVERPRDVFDAYFTAFFNAWVDNQGLRTDQKRWVVAMAPRLLWGESGPRFFADYPDGRAIVPIRDPVPWYASAKRFKRELGSVPKATELWLYGTGEALEAKRKWPNEVLLVRYESVVRDTEGAMKTIAEWLGIEWYPLLLEPTFNRLPTWSNSSFEVGGQGVKREPLEAWKAVVGPKETEEIEEATSELYEQACETADVA